MAVASLVVMGIVAGAFTILALIWSCVTDEIMMPTWKVSPGRLSLEEISSRKQSEVPNITVDAAVNTSHYADIVPHQSNQAHSQSSLSPTQLSVGSALSSFVTGQTSLLTGQSTGQSSFVPARSWEIIEKI